MSIKQRIKKYLEENKIMLKDFEEKTGLGHDWIYYKPENDGSIYASDLKKVAEFLNKPMEWFFQDAPPMMFCFCAAFV